MIRSIGLLLVATFALSIAGLISCGGAQSPATTPRDEARAAVLTLAEGVKVADQTCAAAALTLKNEELAKACADAYDDARTSLLAAESSIDAWDQGASGSTMRS